MRTLIFTLVFGVLFLIFGCSDNSEDEWPFAEKEAIQVTPVEDLCLPGDSSTDDLWQDVVNANLFMPRADIVEDDLPVGVRAENMWHGPDIDGSWLNRWMMSESADYPLQKLEELRNFSVLGEWYNKAELVIGSVLVGKAPGVFPFLDKKYAPQHTVQIHTVFLQTQACAKAFLNYNGESVPDLIPEFKTVWQQIPGETTITRWAILVGVETVLVVEDHFTPTSADWSEYPEAQSYLEMTNRIEFVDLRQLAQTLLNRLTPQLVHESGPG